MIRTRLHGASLTWKVSSLLVALAMLIAVVLVQGSASPQAHAATSTVTPTSEPAGSGFTPRAILVNSSLDFSAEWTASTITYPWSTDITFPQAEAAAGAEHPPFLDACWFSKDMPATMTASNMTPYNTGACLPIKQLKYSNGVITVVPTDNAAYPGNSQIDLTYTVPNTSTIAAEVSKHVVFRYADPDLYTRLYFYKTWNADATPKASGIGLEDMGDYYVQLAARADRTQNYHSTITIECARWCMPNLSAHNNDSNFVSGGFIDGASAPTTSNDTSTASRTIQTFSAVASGSASFNLNTVGKQNMKLGASIVNPTGVNFSHDKGEFSIGGNPPYVRKIFAGTGYGSNLNANGGSVSGTDLNGCTMNGTSNNTNPPCNSDWGQNSAATGTSTSVNGKQVYWVKDNKRQDNCVYNLGRSCDTQANNASAARDAHVSSGAGGGCGTSAYDSRHAYNCLTPRNAPALSLGNWEDPNSSSNRQYKIWFDHVENDSQQTQTYNNYLSELWINGESVTLPESFLCATKPSDYQSYYGACGNIANTYNDQSAIMANQLRDYSSRSIDFSTWKSAYTAERNKWLNMPQLFEYTFTQGPNAGMTVKVSLKNVRMAGEFKGMIDDNSSDVDYTGYCDPKSYKTNDGSGSQAISVCGWAYDGRAKGLLLSTRYEVTIIAPQQPNTTVKAVYYNTANARYITTGMQGVYHGTESELNNVQIWAAPVTKDKVNNDATSWQALCIGGESNNNKQGCGYAYTSQLYTGYNPGIVRFRVRNGYAVAGNAQVSLTGEKNSINPQTIATSLTTKPQAVTDDPDTRYIYFNVEKVSDESLWPAQGSSAYVMGMSRYVLLHNNLSVKDFSVEYLDANYQSLAPAGLNPVTGLDVENNPTFTADRPNVQSLGGQQFTNWKLVWCGPANATTSCPGTAADGSHEPVYSRSSTDDGNDQQGSAIELAPGTLFNVNMVYHLTDPLGDPTYNATHDHMALVANTETTLNQPNLYGTVKMLDKNPDEIYGTPVNLFVGAPGLTATMHTSPWDEQTTGDNATITDDAVDYNYKDNLSTQSVELASNPFPLIMMYSPASADVTLTLIRKIDNIDDDVWPYGDADLPYISLGVNDSQGKAMPANADADGSAASGHVDRMSFSVPTGDYTLTTANTAVGTDVSTLPAGVDRTVDMLRAVPTADNAAVPNWACVVDGTTTSVPVSVVDGKPQITMTEDRNVTCTVTYQTSNVMTTAKIEGTSSTAGNIDLANVHMLLQAVAPNGEAITSLPADGSRTFSTASSPYTSATLGVESTTPQSDGSNVTRVLPGTAFTLTPQGKLGGYMMHIQALKSGTAVTEQNLTNDSNWEDLPLTNGTATVSDTPQGAFFAYRLVLSPVDGPTLPLTGGTAQDYIIITGLVLSAGAITVLAVRRMRNRHSEVMASTV